MIKEKLQNSIKEALGPLGIKAEDVFFEHPTGFDHGDYSTNIAMILSKELKTKPTEIAENILKEINKNKPEEIEKIEIAGPGFINFYLSKKFFVESLGQILKEEDNYGKNKSLDGEKIIIEYTDMNPFKPMHIGHLMSNSIGESLSRIIEANGVELKRATYGGDVGLHVAKCMWGILKLKSELPKDGTLEEKAEFLGKAYVLGANAYEEDENSKKEIQELNQKIYNKSDEEINELYDWGRKASVDYFQEIYEKLGTKFDYQFFESEMVERGMFIVEEFLKKGIFEKSDGAIVFKGENYGLHTRVFVNSQGLPTYETKELGLNKKKFETENFNKSIIITANEQSDYFKVIIKALEFIDSEIANKTKHIAHGMMRLSGGKMSSRKGNVITGESLIKDAEEKIEEKIKDREFSEEQKKEISEQVGLGAIKYSILKQTIGRDIIFDFEKSLSFEGDSGPYLQYAHTRANSVLEKAKGERIKESIEKYNEETNEVEKMLYRFPEIVKRAFADYSPSHIATYLVELSGSFNGYYAKNKIVDAKDENSPYKVALTKAFKIIMKNGLNLLGIKTPSKM